MVENVQNQLSRVQLEVQKNLKDSKMLKFES